jgi:hypothetical protein
MGIYLLSATVNFQSNAIHNQDLDNSKFNHCNIENIKFINGRNEAFPGDGWVVFNTFLSHLLGFDSGYFV